MATPLSSFITQFMKVLAITLRDRDIFCRYGVMSYLFRMTKLHKPCLVSSKKCPLSQASVKCQQTLIYFIYSHLMILAVFYKKFLLSPCLTVSSLFYWLNVSIPIFFLNFWGSPCILTVWFIIYKSDHFFFIRGFSQWCGLVCSC